MRIAIAGSIVTLTLLKINTGCCGLFLGLLKINTGCCGLFLGLGKMSNLELLGECCCSRLVEEFSFLILSGGRRSDMTVAQFAVCRLDWAPKKVHGVFHVLHAVQVALPVLTSKQRQLPIFSFNMRYTSRKINTGCCRRLLSLFLGLLEKSQVLEKSHV